MPAETFTHGRSRLTYATHGEGRPIVLVHGLSGSSRWWRFNIPALEQQHRVYTLDLSGYGLSRGQRSLTVRAAAALIVAWLDHHDLHDVTLVGHSMGGQISLHVAAGAPGRVRNLVLVCASGLLRASAVRTALHLPRAALIGQKRFIGRIVLDSLRAGPWNLWRNAVDLLKDSVQDVLPGVQARTLIIWGERDVLVPLELGRLLHEALPGSQFEVIPRAGHVVMVDDPRRFNALLLAFLSSPGAPGGDVTG
ncbi:alpha/beta fold hydrolase [Deinococcus taeanensis]|uniref:alpha/beta fold hydrolase n=1 Tax=Deinococcus taeanensis TaxID=2737050 RepID=UPI001CDCF83A|nr:alpha/beta fold hydrolase [Deinococcus taeanensis]UBV43789.1 alpha/beta fold hydrolase [Deinococcus taeanensis]